MELKKLLPGTKNILFRTFGVPLKPKWVWLELTERCNSRCSQCGIWKKEPVKDELTSAEMKKILSDPLFSEVEWILNAGGEPTLRNDLEDVIMAQHEALPSASIMLSTNGLLPERALNIAKLAVRHKIKIGIGTSIEGIGEKHDIIRGVKGNFVKTDRLLRELVELGKTYEGLSPSFGFTLTNDSLASIEEVKAYAKQLGVSYLIQWYNESSFYNNEGRDLAGKKMEMIEAMKKEPFSLINEKGLKRLKGQSIKFRCFAMSTFCMIHCNGDVSPCLGRWDVKAGNLRQKTASEIWNSPEAGKIRAGVKKCAGCLNSCGVMWSHESSLDPEINILPVKKLKNIFKKRMPESAAFLKKIRASIFNKTDGKKP
ncbi:MAG: hypothetical protein A2452_01435 [Candidatus Firestonebacteria bacterium RIFOXYC2_FULL_39_67]|nr:MAG: hypothetical protein A2536_03065 [Candidatus Firestonebacteria bacterium RIFOXYD2_FULL_39_29]OGF53614.1 MAG: hypothetical protein A2452_01435 [Candidatus Firestonebacteria bacterium RIFOXYC2_FULL_39_67]OGF54521.1 MAG: hypothetical protein A2497_05820 [Candidatus Firestonebacteria bacterium RifOxyC12_full_39_7]